MPWFFLDTHERGNAKFGFMDSEAQHLYHHQGVMGGLVGFIARRIPLQRIRKAEGICVVSGPGSFSSIRSGVLAANLLARLLQKPLVGVSAAQAEDLQKLGLELSQGRHAYQSYVAPLYDQAPNITISTSV